MNSDGCCRKLCDIEDRWSFEKRSRKNTLKARRASSFVQIVISIRPQRQGAWIKPHSAVFYLFRRAAPVQKAAPALDAIRHQHICMRTPLTQHRDMHMGCSCMKVLILLVPDRGKININILWPLLDRAQHPDVIPAPFPAWTGAGAVCKVLHACLTWDQGSYPEKGEEEAECALHCLSPRAHYMHLLLFILFLQENCLFVVAKDEGYPSVSFLEST